MVIDIQVRTGCNLRSNSSSINLDWVKPENVLEDGDQKWRSQDVNCEQLVEFVQFFLLQFIIYFKKRKYIIFKSHI